MKNIVIFGGGNGLSTSLKGLKEINDINIRAVVTVADSGGSTGQIRKFYKSPALGDLRRVLVSLSKRETFLNQLMNYRFNSNHPEDPLNNHSLGNLIMLATNEMNGFYEGIRLLSNIFDVKGEVIPLTDSVDCELVAHYDDGTTMISEHSIPDANKRIDYIEYLNENDIIVNPRVLEVINEADIIVFSFGSLYTSIIASMALPKVKEALLANKDKTFVYLCNIVTQPDETPNMDAYDHILAIEKQLEHGIIDYIVMNDHLPSSNLIKKYEKTNAQLILPNDRIKNSHCEVVASSLIDDYNQELIRHDTKKIKKAFKILLEKMEE